MKKIAIIGAGNVGQVLGYALAKNDYQITGVVCRTALSGEKAARLLGAPLYSQPEFACREADIIFITTPDRVIEDVCNNIAAQNGFRKGQVVLHTSGAHSSNILSSARRQGAGVLSFHPLQTIPAVDEGLHSLPGSFFAVEGDVEYYPLALELIRALGGKSFFIPTEMKELYHVAACIASNYFVSLMDMALQCFELMGVPAGEAMAGLSPLILGALYNTQKMGPARALTGPIARGDLLTLRSHLEKLEALLPGLLPHYKQMALYTAGLAVRKGTLGKAEEEEIKFLMHGGIKSA